MAKNRAIIDIVERIEPAVERPTERALDANPTGFLIQFRGGETARLLPGPVAAALLDILDDLRRERIPAYVEVEGDDGGIVRLRIPIVAQVTEARELPGGDVAIALFPSHARHILSRSNEDFAALLEALLGRQDADEWLLITETDAHEIIDVRPFRPDPGRPPPREPSWPARLKLRVWDIWLHRLARWWTFRICVWFCCPPRFACCISVGKVWQMFNLVAPTSCIPVNPLAPCIPFLYPDDGCWARAHEMCRLMSAAGVKPAKVWIDGWLTAATKNHPDCEVHWGWHVAPTLCVRTFWCTKTTFVIDPSLFTGPVTLATWKSVQGDPTATLTHTSASVYWHGGGTDPGYVYTNQDLPNYRLQLKLRATTVGSPPYANC